MKFNEHRISDQVSCSIPTNLLQLRMRAMGCPKIIFSLLSITLMLFATRVSTNPLFGQMPPAKVISIVDTDSASSTADEGAPYSKEPNPSLPSGSQSTPGGGASSSSSGSGSSDSANAQGDAFPGAGCNLTSSQQNHASALLQNVSCKTFSLYNNLKSQQYKDATCPEIQPFFFDIGADAKNCTEVSHTDNAMIATCSCILVHYNISKDAVALALCT